MFRNLLILLLVIGFQTQYANAANYKLIELTPDYEHTKFSPECSEFEKQFRAYTTCFDTKEDDGEAWGIPDFVSYEMREYIGKLPKGPKRPSPWITEKEMAKQGLAPTDASYKHTREFLKTHPNWYDRGHLAMKQHAWRQGPNADWNTHTVINAIPQRHKFNAGIWLNMEDKTADWADEFGKVWIIAGPIFYDGEPKAWLGEAEKGEMLIAIPDGAFKIIIREDGDCLKVLAFIYPQHEEGYGRGPYDHEKYQVSVDEIEALTGLDFKFPENLESTAATEIWD